MGKALVFEGGKLGRSLVRYGQDKGCPCLRHYDGGMYECALFCLDTPSTQYFSESRKGPDFCPDFEYESMANRGRRAVGQRGANQDVVLLWCFCLDPLHRSIDAQLKRIKTGALVLFGEDDTFTATGAQQLLDGIEGSRKKASK